MPPRCVTRWCVLAAFAAVSAAACTRHDQRLQQHQEKLESLGATTGAIGEAWLAGRVSGTYARTALEQTFKLVEQERSALARRPSALADARGAQLSEAAERLSRLLAAAIHDVEGADADSVRRRLAAIPIVPPDER